MKISVILTVLNEGEGLATLLDALLTQSLPADEFVIVDGGSRDDTLAILQERARRDARLRVHDLENLRVCDASVFPNIVTGNINAASMMVGWKGAEIILVDARRNS